jgi:hypothetical protein
MPELSNSEGTASSTVADNAAQGREVPEIAAAAVLVPSEELPAGSSIVKVSYPMFVFVLIRGVLPVLFYL